MSKKVNFNVGKKNKQETGNPLENNRRKYQQN